MDRENTTENPITSLPLPVTASANCQDWNYLFQETFTHTQQYKLHNILRVYPVYQTIRVTKK